MSRSLRLLSVALAMASFLSGSITYPARADDAAQNYQQFCAKCHGPGGRGDGPGAATLTARPRNFTDCDRMRRVSDAEAYNVIRNGGAAANLSAEMPAWKDGFEEDETRALVNYVRGFCREGESSGITRVRQR